jgi:hypothetical protein
MNDADGRLQYRCLDRKALLAQSGDPAAVRELADAVVEFNGTGGAPAAVLDQFEARLAQAELTYRRGGKDGIPVGNIVRALNNLGQKLKAPDYAKTDAGEVELLRGVARSEMPHFIASGSKALSPLEAGYLTHLLLYQKIFNETFLLTPAERAAVERESPATSRTIEPNLSHKSSLHPRVKEMLALARHAGSMKLTELVAIGQEFLDDLGIDR